jgi:hypothetical protein
MQRLFMQSDSLHPMGTIKDDSKAYLDWRADSRIPSSLDIALSDLYEIEKTVQYEWKPLMPSRPFLLTIRYAEKDVERHSLFGGTSRFALHLLSRRLPLGGYLALVPADWQIKNSPLMPQDIQRIASEMQLDVCKEIPISPSGNKTALFYKNKAETPLFRYKH